MISKFNIIVCCDNAGGISKDGNMPWNCKEDLKFFKDITIGDGDNAVLMGRLTYLSIPEAYRPLSNRKNVIISKEWKQNDYSNISIYGSLIEALIGLSNKKIKEVFIIGGESIYSQIMKKYLYLCKKLYLTKLKQSYSCDQFYPIDDINNNFTLSQTIQSKDFFRYTYEGKACHFENKYLECLEDILNNGELRDNRTGVKTLSLFSKKLTFDLRDGFPLMTCRQLNFEGMVKEVLFLISGRTDTSKMGLKIWEKNTSREFLDSRGLNDYKEGDLGAGYSFQWRHWGADYKGCDSDYTNEGIDQLSNLIKNIKDDPFSRRHLLSCWNVSDLNKMALEPCHYCIQFNVSSDKKYLDGLLHMRSNDMIIGAPWNIAEYSLLMIMIGHLTNLTPRYYYHEIGDAHIYENHIETAKTLIKRVPKPSCNVRLVNKDNLTTIDDFTTDSFVLDDYESWSKVSEKDIKLVV